VRGDRSAQIEPALRGPQGASGPRSGRADGQALAGEPPLRLQAGVGAAEARRLAGQQVNKKRVHRLWRQEGLKVPDKQRKRRRLLLGESENGCTRRRAEHKDHVWSYDFVIDLTPRKAAG
jgi:transposase InsO family protein